MMLPRCSPGGIFPFCHLCWRFTRQLIPRFPVVRIVVDPVKQLFTARLLVLGPWGFLFADHWFRSFRVRKAYANDRGCVKTLAVSFSYQPEITVTDQLGPDYFGSFDIDCSLLRRTCVRSENDDAPDYNCKRADHTHRIEPNYAEREG
jgi:hypothetical protein